MVISARLKILLQLMHKDAPGGPGVSIREQVLEVPAQKGSYVGLRGGTGRWRGLGGQDTAFWGCHPLLVRKIAPSGHELSGGEGRLVCIRGYR